MQVEELYQLTVWTKKEIEGKEVIRRYQDVLAILNQNAQAGQAQQPFEEQQAVLFETLRNISLLELNNEQMELLSDIGIAPYVGPSAVDSLEDVLFRNAFFYCYRSEKISGSSR